MSDFLKVKGKPNLIRDIHSKGVINTDLSAFKKAKALKAKINKKDDQIRSLEERMEKLEDIIKNLVKE